MEKLNRNTSNSLSKRPIKVLQFGKGNFLRGFADWMIDILNEKANFNGDIQIIESTDNGLASKINEQEGLYHVILEGLKNEKKIRQTRLITSVKGVFNPNQGYKTFLKMGKNPDLELIISNTTEAGIIFDPDDTDFNILPRSFPGKLTALLYYRFLHLKDSKNKKLTVLPCELIDRNGDQLKEMIQRYIWLWKLPDRFKTWLDNHVIFCNTLVDRIVTGFPEDAIDQVQKSIGFKDPMIVKAEPFYLWVIEGPAEVSSIFPAKEAQLAVTFIEDQSPYKTRKVRILNGVHTAMVPIGYLDGIETVRETIENPKTASFIKQIIFDEIIPTLDLPKEELLSYANSVIERFRNPFIKHNLLSIALNSISKFKVRVLPSLLAYTEKKDHLPNGLVKSFAYLILFYRGYFNGTKIPLQDDKYTINFFETLWKTSNIEHVVHQTLANTKFWEKDLTEVPGLKKQIIVEIEKKLESEVIHK